MHTSETLFIERNNTHAPHDAHFYFFSRGTSPYFAPTPPPTAPQAKQGEADHPNERHPRGERLFFSPPG